MSKVFIILGQMPECRASDSQVAVLFGTEHPTGKQLKSMGFGRIHQIDQAEPKDGAPARPTLYMFDRSPAAGEVKVAEVLMSGKKAFLGKTEVKKGEPHSIVPGVKGELAKRLMGPRNVPGIQDFPKSRARPTPVRKFARA
ncbi:hypothetical protein GF318_01235 [Candidatus Micrarchaeota archaeon]|nr:hypothetical protein [Candidatus Micrarchaeota archaeon]